MMAPRDRAYAVAALDVSRETLDRLDRYAGVIGTWQRMLNLVAPSTLPQLWTRHILDSAQLVDLVPATARRWVDLGSGGGFPALVVAAMAADRIGFETILVESDQRKAAFLRTAAREMGLGDRVLIRALRAEEAVPAIGEADVVSARALAPLADLARLSAPLLARGALGVYPKGESIRRELTEWGPPDRFDVSLAPSRTHPSAAIALVRMRAE
jgi:16S rRNA (guanine527-N7)-methyltransferase